MQQIINEIQKLSAQILDLKKQIQISETSKQFNNWIPRKKVMDFFNYKDTQIAELLKDKRLKISEIGNRKFIQKDSLIKLLEENIKIND